MASSTPSTAAKLLIRPQSQQYFDPQPRICHPPQHGLLHANYQFMIGEHLINPTQSGASQFASLTHLSMASSTPSAAVFSISFTCATASLLSSAMCSALGSTARAMRGSEPTRRKLVKPRACGADSMQRYFFVLLSVLCRYFMYVGVCRCTIGMHYKEQSKSVGGRERSSFVRGVREAAGQGLCTSYNMWFKNLKPPQHCTIHNKMQRFQQ